MKQTPIFVIPMHFVQILVDNIIAHATMDTKVMARFAMTSMNATLETKRVHLKMAFMKA